MADSLTAFAPGRVNLIGEHTDYNDGLALPFAIRAGVTVEAEPSDDGRMRVVAHDLGARDEFDLRRPRRVGGWRAFVRGTVAELQATGLALRAARLHIRGTVPPGSGLSSSAALEVALCLAMLAVSDVPEPDRLELARTCSRIENDWVGARTGLLDQIASLCGQPAKALQIDFRTLHVEPVALELDGHTLVTLDSGERHANAGHRDGGGDGEDAGDGYNRRRDECQRACELLSVDSLRDVAPEMAEGLPSPLRERAQHVITENQRVRETVEALREGDLARVGELLNASHASLRDLFAVSTPAVEATVDRLRAAGAIGARIVGGGFGGHVLGLFPAGTAPPEGSLQVEPGRGAHLL